MDELKWEEKEALCEEFMGIYPKRTNVQNVMTEFMQVLKVLEPTEIRRAAKAYAAQCEDEERDEKYIKSAKNFLLDLSRRPADFCKNDEPAFVAHSPKVNTSRAEDELRGRIKEALNGYFPNFYKDWLEHPHRRVMKDGSLGTVGVISIEIKDDALVLTLPAFTNWFREQLEARLDASNEAIRKILQNELKVKTVRVASL